MDIEKAIAILKRHNRWRRSDEDMEMEDPTEIGIAIDTVVDFIEKTLKTD